MLKTQRSTISDIIRLARNAHNEEEEILMEAYNHVAQRPASEKMTIAKLPKVLNYWVKIQQDKQNIIEDIVRMVCIGYILIDDIQDNSIMRDGIPVAHNVYSIGGAVNSAYYVTSIALKRVLQLNHPEYAEDKAYDDLTEGYFNFLIVHAIQTGPRSKEYGTYAYTRTVLEELDKKIREEVERLGGNPLFDKLLDDLYSWKYEMAYEQHSKKDVL